MTQSPKITSLSWGVVKVEGFPNAFKDVKLFPGGAREWDWNETGTSHFPGIQLEDFEELLTHGATTLILSQGVYGRLKVAVHTLKILKEKGLEFHVLKTKEAVELYNQLRQKKPVGALIHSTC